MMFKLTSDVVYERERGFLVLLIGYEKRKDACPVLLATIPVGDVVSPFIHRIEVEVDEG